MAGVSVQKVLDALLNVWEALASFADGIFDVLNTSLSDLVADLTFFDFATPLWEWLLDTIGVGDYTLLDFTFGAIAFFVGYTLLKWLTDVVA